MLRNVYYEILKRWNKKTGTLALYIVIVMFVFGFYAFSGGREIAQIVNGHKQKCVDSIHSQDMKKNSNNVEQEQGLKKSAGTVDKLKEDSKTTKKSETEIKADKGPLSSVKSSVETYNQNSTEQKATEEKGMKENSGKNTSRSVNNVDISNIMWPLKGEVSQGIGISYSKTFGDYRYHDGIDIQGDRGVEVVAVLAGKVTKKETTKSDGIKVTINHGGGWTSIYKHLGDSYLQVGDEVKIGENVGSINQPGMSEIMEGPHLHYTILKDNKVINPLDYLSR